MHKFIKPALISFLAIICLSWVPVAVAATNGQCSSSNPKMKFGATISAVKFNTSASAFDLHSMHGGSGGGLVTGLAYDSLFYEFKGSYSVTDMGNNMVCVALDKIKVYYRARPIVFISNEFPRGTCEFKAILAHENKHVNALKKFHKLSAMEFKRDAQNAIKRLRPVGPISKHQAKGAQLQMEKQVATLLQRSLAGVRSGLSREQNMIDSPKEYSLVNAKCDNWSKLLRLE